MVKRCCKYVFVFPALSVLLATGCSSGAPQVNPLPMTSLSHSQRPHPGPTKRPADPAFTRVSNAARHYYQAITAAAATGKTKQLDALALPSCPCKAVIPYIRESYQRGSISGFSYTLEKVTPKLVKSDVAVVSVTYSVPEVRVLDRGGRATQVDAAIHHRTSAVTLVPRGSHWIVERIDRI